MGPIEHIRTKILKITQTELGAIASTTQASVSRWEKGESEPDRTEMEAIRAEVIARGHAWEDSWFFEVPSEAAA
jgi:DNA-binding transcriptional regulator YiaG